MGTSQSKSRSVRLSLEETCRSNTHGGKARLNSGSEMCSGDHSVSKQRIHQHKSRVNRLRGLRRSWQRCNRRSQDSESTKGRKGSTVPMPWLDKPQQQNVVVSNDDSTANGASPSTSRELAVHTGGPSGDAEGNCSSDCEEFLARSVHLPDDVERRSPLLRAHANWLGYMEEDVVAALDHHPCPNEALSLMYVCCSPEPLPVEHTLEPSSDVLAYVLPGTYLKVLDFTAYSTQMEYLLRLKTAEGWVTGASIQMMRLPHSARIAASRPSSCESYATKGGSQQRGGITTGTSVSCFSQHQTADPDTLLSRGKCYACPGGTQELGGSQLGTDASRQVDDPQPSTCWGTVNACRATRFCSFEECFNQPEQRTCFTSLSKLASASDIQSFEMALRDSSPGLSSTNSTAHPRIASRRRASETAQPDEASVPQSSLAAGLSPMEHPFMLFRVVVSRAIPVSANPHLGSPVVGRLLHRQVFPVLDACLACCGSMCSRPGGEADCLLSGLGYAGREGPDILHATPPGGVCCRKTRRQLSCFSRNRRVQLRVCTTHGWVTFDRSIQKLDECDTVYESPVPYEIVADGYLVNVRASLEIEGPVRRTLPPATLVDVYERKVNAEGLMRLRLVDGWINERRKGADDGGLLFAVRVEDYRSAAFVRQMTAVATLLPALCSSNVRARTAAATWLAANAARSGIASTALMEEVDEALVVSELSQCPCCYCRGNKQVNVEALGGALSFFPCDRSSHRCSREAVPVSVKPLVNLSVNGSDAAEDVQSGQHQRVPSDSQSADLSCCLRPLAARDLLLAESPVMGSTVSQVSVFPRTAPRTAEDSVSSMIEYAAVVDGSDSLRFTESFNGCIDGGCHRGRCYLEKSGNFSPDFSEVWSSVCGQESQPNGLWSNLYSLVKAASALPKDLGPVTLSCRQCESMQPDDVSAHSSCLSEHSDEEGETVRSSRVACSPCSVAWPPCRQENDYRLLRGETAPAAPQQGSIGTEGDTCDARDHIGGMRKGRSSVPLSISPHPRSCTTRRSSSTGPFSGMISNHDLSVRREALSPTDTLYQFCVAAVYSSLAEHREPVGPYAVYRPPVGAYVPSPTHGNSIFSSGLPHQSMLAAYKPQQLPMKGRLPIVSSNRCSSFSFHQPPVFVIHKVERIHNGFLFRRYLHERGMLMLMNPRGVGCGLDEAIPNPLLKARVTHPSQESLNEYFLFHGCTEERAGLITISGFDFRRGGENGGKLFGIGTYFSPNASKADMYTRPNNFSARPVGPGPVATVASQKSTQALPLITTRVARPPTTGGPANISALPGIPTQSVAGGGPSASADPLTNKASGSIRFGKGSWLGTGKGCADISPTGPGSLAPCKQGDGITKSAKERGGLRAACAKLARQGGGGSGSRQRETSASGQALQTQKISNSPQGCSQQQPKPQGSGGPKSHQGGGMGALGSSADFTGSKSIRCLLIARVCLGEVYKALAPMPDARMPPNKPNPEAVKLAYDSVMAECRTRGGVVDGVEFVVFERAQALPQFIVTYSHAAHCQCAECHRQPFQ